MNAINARVTEYRGAVKEREASLVTTREAQAAASVTLEADKARVLAELKAMRARRDGKAAKVSKLQMTRYDRIQKRERSVALFGLRGQSCSNCDTMLPMQRCNAMSVTGVPEICEGCGVLLYASE
jgi:predicted  nucleic acid-binding Zn-ribbon protein